MDIRELWHKQYTAQVKMRAARQRMRSWGYKHAPKMEMGEVVLRDETGEEHFGLIVKARLSMQHEFVERRIEPHHDYKTHTTRTATIVPRTLAIETLSGTVNFEMHGRGVAIMPDASFHTLEIVRVIREPHMPDNIITDAELGRLVRTTLPRHEIKRLFGIDA